jgi:hypothetical protein
MEVGSLSGLVAHVMEHTITAAEGAHMLETAPAPQVTFVIMQSRYHRGELPASACI